PPLPPDAPDGRPPPPPPPPPDPPSPGARRSFFVTWAVAQRMLGPISSATTFDRLSPSGVSQLRCSRRPVTMTREPRLRLSAAFSAISRQQTTSKNEVASSHSCVWRFCHRRLTANPKLAVAWPVLVKRSSGSRVMFPTSVTTFPLAISALPTGGGGGRGGPAAGDLVRQADHLVAQDFISQDEHPLHVGDGRGLCGQFDDHVVALALVLQLVGERPTTPPLHPARVAALGLECGP